MRAVDRFLSLIRGYWVPAIGVAVLVGFAARPFPEQGIVLVALLLFLPLLDPQGLLGTAPFKLGPASIFLIACIGVVLLFYPEKSSFVFTTLIWAAFPEEWYFRRYLLLRLGGRHRANFLVTGVFASLHGLVWGWEKGLSVVLPSLLFGYLYQHKRDVVLVVLLHCFANVVYVICFERILKTVGELDAYIF